MCVVGVGLGTALLGGKLPKGKNPYKSTEIIGATVDAHPDMFPLLNLLVTIFATCKGRPNSPVCLSLNKVWAYYRDWADSVAPHVGDLLADYAATKSAQSYLVDWLCRRRSLNAVVRTLLEAEFQRMLSFWYAYDDTTNKTGIKSELERALKQQPRACDGFVDFLGQIKTEITWISPNYDTVLETLLEADVTEERDKKGRVTVKQKLKVPWRYWFQEMIGGRASPMNAKHVIVKPHGSLNIKFHTHWPKCVHTLWPAERREAPAMHELKFVDRNNRLRTFAEGDIGCPDLYQKKSKDDEKDPICQCRPWLVGYLPDEMQREVNSPGMFADPAHDLCKANLGYTGMALASAKSLVILGYSMPQEDQWIWNRLAALPRTRKREINIYVASGTDTARIIRDLESLDFGRGKTRGQVFKLNKGRI